MVQIARNYQDAIALIASNPNTSFVATDDGKGIRQKNFSDSIKSFGSFFAFHYKDNLRERDSKVAQALLHLYQASGPLAGSAGPQSNQQLRRYFDAYKAQTPPIQQRSVVKQGSLGKNSASIESFSTGKAKASGLFAKSRQNIFDGNAHQINVQFTKNQNKKIVHELESLATTADTVGSVINQQHGLTEQYLVDSHRQTNVFEDGAGIQKVEPLSNNKEANIAALKKFAKTAPAAVALSALANQAALGVIYQHAPSAIIPGKKVIPISNAKTATQEYHLKRLPNGNVQFSLNYFTGLELVHSPDNAELVSVKAWPEGAKASKDHYDQKIVIDLELDAKALDRGVLKVVSSQPISYRLNINPSDAP